MFVNNGQLGRKYISPERLRTAGNHQLLHLIALFESFCFVLNRIESRC